MSDNAAPSGVMSDTGPELIVDDTTDSDDRTDYSSDCEPQSESSGTSSSDESCDCDECRGNAPSSPSSGDDCGNDSLDKANMFALRWRANVTPSEVITLLHNIRSCHH